MILYGLVKLVAYCAWCWAGLHWLAAAQSSLGRALQLGALRWSIGLLFGILAAIAIGSVQPQSVASLYFGIYMPLRLVEWSILATILQRFLAGDRSRVLRGSAWLWVLGGIVVSFATDLASPQGMSGRFCVGRCLC